MGRLYKRGAKWYADYVDANGERVRRCTKFANKQLAKKLLAKWETESALVGGGLKTSTRTGDPLKHYLKQFRSSLVSGGKSKQHIDRTVQLIRQCAEHNGWHRLGDIAPSGISTYTEYLLTDHDRSARTIGSMLTAIRTFCRWCVRQPVPLRPTRRRFCRSLQTR